MDPPSRVLIETAVAGARPEARALIERVAGYTDVSVAIPSDGALGTTQPVGGRYDVVLDLGETQQLDAGIPPQSASRPAPRGERFAETFAKWAMGNDLGADLYIGYAVPPPSAGFDAWAAPLRSLRN